MEYRFSKPLMPDFSHSFCFFFFCVIVVINKPNKLKRNRSQNDVRLSRFGSALIVICLIQREVILAYFVN